MIMTSTLEESYQYCRQLSRRTGKNFYFSFLGLPRPQFDAMCALYAFMRITDDVGDRVDVPVETRKIDLERWETELSAALNGWPATGHEERHIVFPALCDAVDRYDIPPDYLFAVIQGVRRDLQPLRFDTFDDLSGYCYQVAGVVGLCCIHIWGFNDERAIRCAVDCGLAFQLTNILRDLAEDADMGRVYLPLNDLDHFAYSEADLSRRCNDERFTRLMQFEVQRVKMYYRKAEELFDYLEPPGKPIYRAMLRIYGGLLREIERQHYDVFQGHVTLPVWRKLLIAADAVLERQWSRAVGR